VSNEYGLPAELTTWQTAESQPGLLPNVAWVNVVAPVVERANGIGSAIGDGGKDGGEVGFVLCIQAEITYPEMGLFALEVGSAYQAFALLAQCGA